MQVDEYVIYLLGKVLKCEHHRGMALSLDFRVCQLPITNRTSKFKSQEHRVLWCIPIISDTQEVETGGSWFKAKPSPSPQKS
jgi:hypothetical protein